MNKHILSSSAFYHTQTPTSDMTMISEEEEIKNYHRIKVI